MHNPQQVFSLYKNISAHKEISMLGHRSRQSILNGNNCCPDRPPFDSVKHLSRSRTRHNRAVAQHLPCRFMTE
jgi:hypothetical protein